MNYRDMHPWFNTSFQYYPDVPEEIKSALWNYLAYGLPPGGFTTAVLQNDFVSAAVRAHPALTSNTFRSLAKWLVNSVPAAAWGNLENMNDWMKKTQEERTEILIEWRLRPGEFDILRGAPQ